jgi:predicted amidohydrolase YtcJ
MCERGCMLAELVLINGKIITMNPSQPHAQAIAIADDKIIKVGGNNDVKGFISKDTKVIDLKGKTVVPGFIDTHIHVSDLASVLSWIDLSDVTSIEGLKALIGVCAKKTPKGKWIIGRGWEQCSFAENRLPNRYDLDEVSQDNPVLLYQKCGQICIANSNALQLAGLIQQKIDVAGGMDRNMETGELTGVLHDDATSAVWKFVPTLTKEELTEAVTLACEKIVASGITSVCWIIFSAMELSIIEKLSAQGRLPLSIRVVIPVDLLDASTNSPLRGPSGVVSAKIAGVMIFADGYLAARTAAMSKPYSDCPSMSGKLLYTQAELNELAAKVQRANLQLIIHAAGDLAVETALTTIEEQTKCAVGNGFRNRIEQAAILNQRIIERFKHNNVVVSVQPCVIDSEFSVYSAADRLGPDRLPWLYPLKTLIASGIRVIGGSDCPMEPLSPLLGIQAAVTRSFVPQERITVEEALRFYTTDAAYSFSEEHLKGSLEKGKFADIAVLSHDLMTIELCEVGTIEVEMTIVKGKIVCSKNVL